MYTSRFGPVLALLVLFAGLTLPAAPAAAQESGVSPAAAPPDTTFQFFATGFQAFEPVNYWVSLPDGNVVGDVRYEVEADAAGQADWSWKVPRRSIPGFWLMVGRGRESGIERAIPFEVLDNGSAEPLISVEPPEGGPETRFRFFARGFDDDERVSYWLIMPDGSTLGEEDWRTNANDGRARWSWKSPDNPVPGRWGMVARGNDSQRERVVFFTIRVP
jgi:hypothetical protein